MSDKEKAPNDIKEWCYKYKDKIVFFEQFESTLDRSNHSDDDDEDDDEEKMRITGQMTAIYKTPLGSIVIPEHTDSHKHFKFWTMHAKIRMTQQLYNLIENVDGVETLEPYSPYRIRIGVAPLFVDSETLSSIQKIVEDFNTENKQIKALPVYLEEDS